MAEALVDTSIVVDLLRAYPPSLQWFSSQTYLGMSSVVLLELLDGVDNKREMQRTLKQVREFESIETTGLDFDWAREQLIRYKLSHNVGMMACLIAAGAFRLQIPLFTLNLKHFAPLLGTRAHKPY